MNRSLTPVRSRDTSKASNGSSSSRRRAGVLLVAALTGVTALTANAPSARADDVSRTGKGVVGGALLGAELVVIVESIAGARKEWTYLLGAGLGAVGGGIAGHFIEQGSTDGRVPVYMLAGGLALIIPAIVLTLNGTRYLPDETATEDKAPTNGPAADPGKVGGSVVLDSSGATTRPATTPTTTPTPIDNRSPATPSTGGGGAAPPSVPFSFLHMREGSMRFGIPLPEVKPMWSLAEQRKLGLAQGTELRMPLFNVTF